MLRLHAHRIENVHAKQLYFILLCLGVFFRLYLAESDFRQSTHAEDLTGPHVLEQVTHHEVRRSLHVCCAHTHDF